VRERGRERERERREREREVVGAAVVAAVVALEGERAWHVIINISLEVLQLGKREG
jgi:hypothetical protein